MASGISMTRTALPACLQPTHTEEPKTDLVNAQQEAKLVYGQVITEVLRKTGAWSYNAGIDDVTSSIQAGDGCRGPRPTVQQYHSNAASRWHKLLLQQAQNAA